MGIWIGIAAFFLFAYLVGRLAAGTRRFGGAMRIDTRTKTHTNRGRWVRKVRDRDIKN